MSNTETLLSGAFRELIQGQAQLAKLDALNAERNLVSDDEQKRMNFLLETLRAKKIEATGRVGYLTQLSTSEWQINVTSQSERVFVISHRKPESLRDDQSGRHVFTPDQADSVKEIIASSGFSNEENFVKLKKILQYRHSINPVGISPVDLCQKELQTRMLEPRQLIAS